MTATQSFTPVPREANLTQAVQEQSRVVITHREVDGWRTHKAQLVSGEKITGSIVARVTWADDEPWDWPESGVEIGVTFRAGHKKCMFSTRAFPMAGEPGQRLLRIEWPNTIQQLQRRAYQRATPPETSIIPVRFWQAKSNDRGNTTDRSSMRHGQLVDMSAGGMRIKTADLDHVELEGDYRCVLTPDSGATPLVFDARLRHRESTNHGRAALGFQFIGLEVTPEGRKTLTRIARLVNHFQRHRRNRRSHT